MGIGEGLGENGATREANVIEVLSGINVGRVEKS